MCHQHFKSLLPGLILSRLTGLFLPVITLAAAIFGSIPPASAAGSRLASRDELSNLHVNALAQDSLGYIWVGTANGLCRDKGNGYDIFFSDKADPATIPSNNVTALRYDNGVLWVATARGIASKKADSSDFVRYSVKSNKFAEGYYRGFFRFAGKLFTYGYNGLFEVNPADHTLVPRVNFDHRDFEAAAIDSSGHLWLSSGDELICLDKELHIVKRIALPPDNITSAMLADGDHVILGTRSGLMLLNPADSQIEPMPGAMALRGTPVNTMIPLGQTDKLIIGTRGRGPLVFDKKNGLLTDLNRTIYGNVPSIDVTALILDDRQNLWLGTFDKGVFMMSQHSSTFNRDRSLIDFYRKFFVTRVAGDSRGRFWVGTRYRGLSSFNPASGEAVVFNKTNTPWLAGFPGQFVQEMCFDSSGRLWVGMDDGLFCCTPSPDGASLRNPLIFPHVGNVVSIAEAPDKSIWVGSSNKGLFRISPEGKLMGSPGSSALFTSGNITRILPFDDSRMLVASFLDNIYLIDINTFTATALDSQFQDQLDMAVDVFRARNGNLWIGTYDNGLLCYNPRTRKLSHFTDFKSHDILAIREDTHGNIWCSSSYGIYRIDPHSGNITSYLKQEGINGNQYHEKCSFSDSAGNIYFGGNYGLQQILPDNTTTLSHHIPIYLTELRTLNRDTPGAVAQTDLPFLRNLNLDYDNNALSIGFTGLSYNSPVEYAYMLEGFDKMWIFTGEYNHAIYSNLPSGSYRFLVKVKENDTWSEPTMLLNLSVAEAPWLHPFAKAGYLLLIIVLISVLTQLYIRLRLEKERLSLAEKKVEDERQMSQRKLNFFNNISHELRTPITLIYAPVKYLHKNHRTLSQQEIENTLDYIDRNVDRLLALTTQILKFRTVQGETLPLKVSEYDPVTQIDNIIRLYNIYAAEKNLSVAFICSHEPFKAVYDSDKLEKIINNLLFNAVKYTPPKGHITVRLDVTDSPEAVHEHQRLGSYMEIQVVDDGVGIPDEESKSLFTRFRRFLNPFSFRKEGGFGIGLNFVKNLVVKHHGAIICRRNAVKGTTFVVDIPIQREAYAPDEWISEDTDDSAMAPSAGDSNPVVPTTLSDEVVAAAAVAAANPDAPDEPLEPEGPERHKILVVEDKKEMADFIASVFADEADVIIAADGMSGLQKATDELPDVIISDVMMPLMNGYEMLSRVKSEAATCHIPVVLLSAKSTDEDHIEGYEKGADLYMAKPFNPQVLRSAVNSILAKIERQKHQVVSTAGTTEEPPTEEMSPLDRKFLTKLYEYINENIGNSDLNVNLLGRDLGFSRTNFYRKIKALTGVTPNELLRVCRLNRAAQLLRTREYTIGEIADMTGFGTQSHFSNLFKKQFGVTPSNYPPKCTPKQEPPSTDAPPSLRNPDDLPPVPLS